MGVHNNIMSQGQSANRKAKFRQALLASARNQVAKNKLNTITGKPLTRGADKVLFDTKKRLGAAGRLVGLGEAGERLGSKIGPLKVHSYRELKQNQEARVRQAGDKMRELGRKRYGRFGEVVTDMLNQKRRANKGIDLRKPPGIPLWAILLVLLVLILIVVVIVLAAK
jgi:hypothetical protein